jgi:hypothetical protein
MCEIWDQYDSADCQTAAYCRATLKHEVASNNRSTTVSNTLLIFEKYRVIIIDPTFS